MKSKKIKYGYNLFNIAQILRSEGIQGMYRGFSISIICIPIFNTIYFPIYGEMKGAVQRSTSWKDGDVRLYATSAGLSGTICNVLTNPLWLMRTRMQVEIFKNVSQEHFNKKYGHGPLSLFYNIRKVVQNEGIMALTKGIQASFIGIIHPIVFFPMYEKLKLHMKASYPEHYQEGAKPNTSHVLFCTTVSKVFASACSYPHEVLRSRLQASLTKDSVSRQSAIALAKHIVRTEGPLALYSGFMTNLARIVPNYALIFLIYENMCHILKVDKSD